MTRKSILAVFLSVSAAIVLSGCHRSPVQRQIRFGVWASQKDLWDEALFRWKKAVALDPRSVAAHNNLAVAYEKKSLWEEALKEYEEALRLDPKNTYVKSNLDKLKRNMEAAKKAASPEKEKPAPEKEARP
jgi:tetratricopeptide (TPR) repeat protein